MVCKSVQRVICTLLQRSKQRMAGQKRPHSLNSFKSIAIDSDNYGIIAIFAQTISIENELKQ